MRNGFKVCTGARFLGSLIGDGKSKQEWLKVCMSIWEQNIHTIRKMAGKIVSPSDLFKLNRHHIAGIKKPDGPEEKTIN